MQHYSLHLIWSEEDGAYIATVPEIPQLKVVSKTLSQAVLEADEAISEYIEDQNRNQEPSADPRTLTRYSGQFRLRIPRILHATLATEAEGEKISLNSYIMYLLSQRHAKQPVNELAEPVLNTQLRETIQYLHEFTSNMTISGPFDTPDFSWRNDSSTTITQIH